MKMFEKHVLSGKDWEWKIETQREAWSSSRKMTRNCPKFLNGQYYHFFINYSKKNPHLGSSDLFGFLKLLLLYTMNILHFSVCAFLSSKVSKIQSW